MEDHQWQDVVRAMNVPAWTERFSESASRFEFPEEIDAGIAEWTANLSKAEATLQYFGVPATENISDDDVKAIIASFKD
jgi:crotonobetainyl-CoA:carnitine CoA-transferase CaiB-like acyl-CoA transferase